MPESTLVKMILERHKERHHNLPKSSGNELPPHCTVTDQSLQAGGHLSRIVAQQLRLTDQRNVRPGN